MRIVIIGNGVAGMEAALTVRTREPSWDITIVSEESDHLFSRTALMWVHSGQMSHRDIEPYERDVYERMSFTRVRARAVGLDTDARTVLLAGGHEPLPYDRLLIACGSRARSGPWPGSDLAGVGHFVTLSDLEWLEREVHGGPSFGGRPPNPDAHLSASTQDSPYRMRAVARDQRGSAPTAPAVVGGGLIGMEAVEVLLSAGLRPKLFVRDEWFWPIALDDAESAWITERAVEHGVDVRLGESVTSLDGDERLRGLTSDQRAYECDLCVIAIGVVPNTDWLRPSADGVYQSRGPSVELDRAGGVVVDAGLKTSVDGVFAAGDCASVLWFEGSSRPEQLWYTARDQGRVAARRLLGDGARYDRGAWYNSAKLMDIEYTTAGLVNMNLVGERNWSYEEQGAVRSMTRVVLSPSPHGGERVVGFNLLGRRWDHSVLLRWIAEHRSLEHVLSHLGEASFDTEMVPRLVIPKSARLKEPIGAAPSTVQAQVAAPTVTG